MPIAPSTMNGSVLTAWKHETGRERHGGRHAVGHERRARGQLEDADRARAGRNRLRERDGDQQEERGVPGQVEVEGLQDAPGRERQHEPGRDRPEHRHGGEPLVAQGGEAGAQRFDHGRTAVVERQSHDQAAGGAAHGRDREHRDDHGADRQDGEGEHREALRHGDVRQRRGDRPAAARRARPGRRRAPRRRWPGWRCAAGPSRGAGRGCARARRRAPGARCWRAGRSARPRTSARSPGASRAGRASASARSASRRRPA